MLKKKEDLYEKLQEGIEDIRLDKEKMEQIAKNLAEFDISPGEVSKYLIHSNEEFPQMSVSLLCLITEQVYQATKLIVLDPVEWFTDIEIKQSKQYSGAEEREEILSLPQSIPDVSMIDSENYSGVMDVKTLRQWMISGLFRYNFDTQRSTKWSKSSTGASKEIDINKRHVREIRDHLLNRTLFTTLLSFNCLAGTSDTGDEVVYNSKSRDLLITEGTYIDILDGMHRILGVIEAYEIDPTVGDFKFQVTFKNYSTKIARKMVAQINTTYQMAADRVKEMREDRYSDTVVRNLQKEKDFRGKIVTDEPNHSLGQLVSFITLSDAINDYFKPETSKDVMDITEYLTDYFNYLFGTYSDEFLDNISESHDKSLLNYNEMFVGYIILAKKMLDNEIKISKLPKILSEFDFDINSDEWKQLKIVSKRGKIMSNAKKKIEKLFNEIDLEKLLSIS